MRTEVNVATVYCIKHKLGEKQTLRRVKLNQNQYWLTLQSELYTTALDIGSSCEMRLLQL